LSDALGINEMIPSYRRAIRDGIDVIQTDHPLRVLRAIELENQGEALPGCFVASVAAVATKRLGAGSTGVKLGENSENLKALV
jgi:hypothetical protein